MLMTSCSDLGIVNPTADVNPTLGNPILPRAGSLVTESQLEDYANMTLVSQFAGAMQYQIDNLGEDTTDMKIRGTEAVLLDRMNAYLTLNSLDEIEELPSYFYYGDEVANMPSLPTAVRDVLEDVEDILIDHASDPNGGYDEFKYFIENLDIESLPSGNQVQTATILYNWDILFHYLDDVPVQGFHWWSFVRCCTITVGTAVGVSAVATPLAGICAGAVAWAQTDACFDN